MGILMYYLTIYGRILLLGDGTIAYWFCFRRDDFIACLHWYPGRAQWRHVGQRLTWSLGCHQLLGGAEHLMVSYRHGCFLPRFSEEEHSRLLRRRGKARRLYFLISPEITAGALGVFNNCGLRRGRRLVGSCVT